MKQRIQFLIIYFLFWVILFQAARIIFLSYHIVDTKELTLEMVYGIFRNGMRLDLSMAGFLCVVPYVLVGFSNYLRKGIFEGFVFTYTFIAVFLIILFVVMDLEVYNVWGNRLDMTPFAYLSSASEAFRSAKSSPLGALFVSFILLVILSFYIVYRIIADRVYGWNFIKNWPFMGVVGLAIALLWIPVRGGIGTSSLSPSTVYFSKNNFANAAALNPTWNLLYSITHPVQRTNNFTYLPKSEAQEAWQELYRGGGNKTSVIQKKRPNVVFILTDRPLDPEILEPELPTPKIKFPYLYANSDHIEEGLLAIMNGFAAPSGNQVFLEPAKVAKLPFLSHRMFELGYRTEFYSLPPVRRSSLLKPHALAADYSQLVDRTDFSPELWTGKSAETDVLLYDRFLFDHAVPKSQPFFSTLFLWAEDSDDWTVQNLIQPTRSTSYNKSGIEPLRQFLDKAKQSSWWEETLVVILPLKGALVANDPMTNLQTPMYWTGGAVSPNAPEQIQKIGNQSDLPATLLGQLGEFPFPFLWSRDLLSAGTKSWAFFSGENGMVLLKPQGLWIYDFLDKKRLILSGDMERRDRQHGLSLQQRVQQSWIDL